MKSTASFFESFKKAGYLVPASWTPSVAAGAGTAIATDVRYREMDEDFLDGMVVANFPSMEYPVAWLPGLIEGELVTLDLSGVGAAAAQIFTVRKPPVRGLDGTVAKAYLKKS